MRINPIQPVPQYPQPKHVTYRLFDANGEIRVGDVVQYNRKPCFVEHIASLVTIVTMDERKLMLDVRPHQIGCVLQKGDTNG